MDFDKKEVCTYLDGVPFVVGQKFCPPRSVNLPFAVNYQLPSDVLTEEYDFSVEEKFLRFYEITKKEEEAAAAAIEDEGAKTALETSPSSSNDVDVHPPPHTANVPLWNDNTILQPKSQIQNKDLASSRSNSEKKINLSDFENDTTSPFDYMELQTINDLEELSTVFQGMCKNQKESQSSELSESNNKVDDALGDRTQSIGNVSKSISFPLPENFSLSNSNANSNPDTNYFNSTSVNSNSFSKSINKNKDGYLSYSYPDVPNVLNEHPFVAPVSEKVRLNSDNVINACPALSQVPCVSSFTGQNTNWLQNRDTNSQCMNAVPLRGSKSIPDLTSMLPNEEVHKVERSHTPPASVFSLLQTDLSDDRTFVKRPLIDNPVKHGVLSSNGLLTSTAFQTERNFELPDPYNELSAAERTIVDSITDMGFHQGQVSRTVKHLGIDEKKVVDHLCQIQALEESGYDRLEAEAALHLHDYDKQEAIRYLDLLVQFQDLGFEKDAIKKALVKNKNDRDKVIDALLS